MAWRQFTRTKEFEAGITHLLVERKLSVRGKDGGSIIQEGLQWGAYVEALQDLTDVLSHIQKAEKSTEDDGLEKP